MTRAAGVARAVPVLAVALLVGNQLADPRANVAEWVFNLGFLAYAVVGALIVRGRPRNPVGWLFCLIGLSTMAGNLLGTYARSHSGATVAAWFDAVGGAPVVVFLMLAVLLFPTGHYLSRSWRRVGTGLVIANAAAVVVVAFEPGPLSSVPRVRNPLGLDAAAGLLHALAAAHPVLTTVTLLCPIVEVVDRFRRSRGLERQQ